jgi:UDP-N-acetylmuramate dehydrogenase
MDPLARLRSHGRVLESEPLGPLTTYKFGGPARYLVTIDGVQDLRDAWAIAGDEGIGVVALGRGSNLVIAGSGFDGVVLRAGPGLSHRSIGPETVAGAAVPLPVLARESVKAGRGGLAFYTGVPGSVGGAVRMNAGCHGSDTAAVLISACVFDALTNTVSDRTPDELGLRYRHSDLDDLDFVLEARFATTAQDPEEGDAEIREITRWRREHQPGGTFNAGSVFKNPAGDSAGRLIDSVGLKGLSVGAVSVSERHANFFVAGDGATAQDVFDLVGEVARRVRAATGIDLEPEIRFVGDFA